jgi:hypothetical protein
MTNEHIEAGEIVKLGCGATIEVLKINSSMGEVVFVPDESGGLYGDIGEQIDYATILFYTDQIPEVIHLLQRIYKTSMEKRYKNEV